jgi:DNA-binding transcriptional MerR regulator
MDTQGLIAGPLSVLCIIALVMGTASAAVITATASTSSTSTGPFHKHPSPESLISFLEQQGVDVSEVKAALQDGDTEAVHAWLEAHRPTRPEGAGRSPPDLADPARQQEIITRLEEKGVDVTEAKTALQNGDTDAVKAWLEAHRPEKPDGTGRAPPDLSDPVKLQEIITRLEEKGVDVTGLKTAFQNGDTDAVKAWLEAHRPEKPDGAGRSPPDLSDPVQEQKIIDRLEERGVDITEVEADLQAGDTTAVQTWLETYLHSHEGEMGFHHPPAESPVMSGAGTTD